jgi:DNA-binding NarL/FixJ family response regulator
MPKPLIQIDDEVREMTDDEYTLHLKSQKENEELEKSMSNARQSALAKLAKLGLTEEEIASL